MELEKNPWNGHGTEQNSMEFTKIPWNLIMLTKSFLNCNKIPWNLKKFHGMAMELKQNSMEFTKRMGEVLRRLARSCEVGRSPAM